MTKRRGLNIFRYFFFITISFLVFTSCTDPVQPEFQYEEGIVFIEGFVSTVPGVSFVTINESAIEFGVYVVNFVEDAQVGYKNEDTEEIVQLTENLGAYFPPKSFKAQVGDSWILQITLNNGTNYASSPEKIAASVPLTSIDVIYDSELEFQEINGGKFVPGHEVQVSFEDPLGKNYYYWTYRTYENLDFCEKCVAGIFRDGECQNLGSAAGWPYFDYACETDCWRIRLPESIAIFEDEFSDGKSINNFSIGNLPLYTKENMVVEVQQISLNAAAYGYYKVLKDIVDNNSGLNAPPPAALVGNLINVDDSEDFVFGRFTGISASTASVFIDRTLIEEDPLESRDPIIFEPQVGCPFPPPCTTFAPCSETRFRTAAPPPGWIDN